MSQKPFVVAICGSLSHSSTTRAALSHALDFASAEGADTELIDLRKWDIPLFDPDDRERGDSRQLKRTVKKADSVIMGTPVYHGMVSSALKNAFDYLGKDEFSGTTVGLLATAGGGSYAPTLEHLRTGVRTVHGWVLPHEVGIPNASAAFDAGEIVEKDIRERIEHLGKKSVRYANIEQKMLSKVCPE